MAGITQFNGRNDTIDLNDAEVEKWYLVGTSNANKPENTTTELGYVHTILMGVAPDGAGCLFQKYISRKNSTIYIRHYINSSSGWTAWAQL